MARPEFFFFFLLPSGGPHSAFLPILITEATMLELLAPAGNSEAVRAAVRSGADAVYLGCGQFNARRNAHNLTKEELADAVTFCHVRGVKVYFTLNTLITDRELPEAVSLAVWASQSGADAILVQDLGLVRVLRQSAPDLPIHASTQMTIHSLDGILAAADLGIRRVVLSRELSRQDLAYLCEHSPIETEVFVHGSLCICYSGQCYMSSVIGERSGNRGLCAQPCRLMYGWEGQADEYPLSQKDMSLARHLRELSNLGVTCVKIEGRMKRPEYVAVVTKVYADALREGKDPTAQDLHAMEEAFSRQGFTDGYFENELGPQMFGIHENAPEPKKLYAMAKSSYEKESGPGVSVRFYAMIRSGQPIQVGVEDLDGHTATAQGPVPEAAQTKAVSRLEVETQLSKTGGTPYRCIGARSVVEKGLAVPVSVLNGLRRQVLEDLTRQRSVLPRRHHQEYKVGARYENRREPPIITVSLRSAGQLTFELQKLKPALVYLPAEEIRDHPETVQTAQRRGISIAASLPRICFDREKDEVLQALESAWDLGVTEVLTGNPGLARAAAQMGFLLRGDYGLNVFNSQAEKEYKRMGFQSVTASFELKLAQIRDLSKAVDTEMIVYGRLPLMITQQCLIKNHYGRCVCTNVNQLTDRKGMRFPVVPAFGCRNEILNSHKLFLADKASEYQQAGLWAVRLQFTTENALECVQVLERYLGLGGYTPNNYTRGLYYRGV